MRNQILTAWIVTVMAIIGFTVIGSALFTITRVGDIEETWRNFDKGTAGRLEILSELRSTIGFGGLIHGFKNYVLRMDVSMADEIQVQISRAVSALAAYRSIGVNEKEESALQAIGAVIVLYRDNLAVVGKMASEGKTPTEIDYMVKIDDTPALEAIELLDIELHQARRVSSSAVYNSVASISLIMRTALVVSAIIFIVLIVGVSRYLKSRKERNQAISDLAAKTAMLEATLNNVDQGISFADENLNLVSFNQRFLELLNFPLDRFQPGDPFEHFIRYNAERGEYGPGDVESQIKERIDLAKEFTTHHFERVRPDGTVLEIRGNSLPNGEGFVTTYSDITERKKAEQQLIEANRHLEERRLELKKLAQEANNARDASEAANRSKSEFLANMSHELRTPLNAVIGFSDMMQNELLGPVGNEQYLSYAKDIHSSGEHLLGLINDILDLSKIESGEMELYEEPVNIKQIVKSSLTLLKTRAEDGRVSLQNDATDPLPALNADARKIKQIIINLLSNAVKFTPEGGKVSIAARVADDGGFSIVVTDTGIGIAPEDIQKVMKPFVQADSSLARKFDGTGLGLPLTKALTEIHGGRFDIRSELGVGTEVTVHFPAHRTISEYDQDSLSGVA